MKKITLKYHKNLPIFMEKGVDGFYIAECPVLEGCYSQGKTLDEALKNIRQVISMVLQEASAKAQMMRYVPQEFSLHTVQI